MKFIRGLGSTAVIKPSALTIGSFDALHLGHQALINALHQAAGKHELSPTVMLFEPQPREYLHGDLAPPRVLRLRDKVRYLASLGVEQVICLRFNAKLASLSAKEFIDNIIIELAGARWLIVGSDFRFGYQRQGDYDYLAKYGQSHNLSVHQAPTVLHQGRRISSTWVRQALQHGQLELAGDLLGRQLTLSGKVGHGDKRGRLLGFPTMNIFLEHTLAVSGVYAVKLEGLDAKIYYGVANVGTRPTVSGSMRQLLEVHLFAYQGEAYGQTVAVVFLHQLRSEQKFADIAALKKQIAVDIEAAQHYLTHNQK